MTPPQANAATIQATLLDLGAKLMGRELSVSIDHGRAEIRVSNPQVGVMSQTIAVGVDNGAIIVYWVWVSPAPIPEPSAPVKDGDQAAAPTWTTEAPPWDIGDPANPTASRSVPDVREYEPIGIDAADVEAIARRVWRVLRPAEASAP